MRLNWCSGFWLLSSTRALAALWPGVDLSQAKVLSQANDDASQSVLDQVRNCSITLT